MLYIAAGPSQIDTHSYDWRVSFGTTNIASCRLQVGRRSCRLRFVFSVFMFLRLV